MAMPESNAYSTRSRLRSRECTFAFLAGLIVLAFVFYSREASGLRPAAADTQHGISYSPNDETGALKPSPPSAIHDSNAASPGYTLRPGDTSAPGSASASDSGLSAPSSGGAALKADSPKAVIIESAIIPNLIPIMLHFANVLGPSWGMILFTKEDGWVEPLSPAFQRLVASGRLEVRFLPRETALSSSSAVSTFLTSPWLWEQVESARRVLLFQTDSILCSKSEAAVDDYLEYDFAGAPIAPAYGRGYNGGLSIRNPRRFLEVTRTVDFAASGHEFEDQYFYAELSRLGASMPSEDVAKTFSVETIYYETPLGYHQPQRWQAAHMSSIEEWCPEVKMLIGRRAQ